MVYKVTKDGRVISIFDSDMMGEKESCRHVGGLAQTFPMPDTGSSSLMLIIQTSSVLLTPNRKFECSCNALIL